MPEKRKVYQYTSHKKGFEFYDKMLMLVFEDKPFFDDATKELLFYSFIESVYYSIIKSLLFQFFVKLFLLYHLEAFATVLISKTKHNSTE